MSFPPFQPYHFAVLCVLCALCGKTKPFEAPEKLRPHLWAGEKEFGGFSVSAPPGGIKNRENRFILSFPLTNRRQNWSGFEHNMLWARDRELAKSLRRRADKTNVAQPPSAAISTRRTAEAAVPHWIGFRSPYCAQSDKRSCESETRR